MDDITPPPPFGPPPAKPYVSRVRGDYPSYEAAKAVCPRPVYDDGDVPGVDRKVRAAKYRAHVEAAKPLPQPAKMAGRLLPYQAALSFVDRRKLSILDVGGGDGQYFHELRAVYGDDFRPPYDVLEAPEVVAAYREIRIPHIRYFDDPDQLRGRRYSHVSFGAMLQIMPEPEKFFRQVVENTESDYIFITVFPEHFGPRDRIGIKSKKSGGQDVSHPYWIFSSERWRGIFAEYGDILMACDMPRYRYKLDGVFYAQRGYLIRRARRPARGGLAKLLDVFRQR